MGSHTLSLALPPRAPWRLPQPDPGHSPGPGPPLPKSPWMLLTCSRTPGPPGPPTAPVLAFIWCFLKPHQTLSLYFTYGEAEAQSDQLPDYTTESTFLRHLDVDEDLPDSKGLIVSVPLVHSGSIEQDGLGDQGQEI